MDNEEKTYPTIMVANVAHRIMADQVLAWYGEENIEKIAPSNEVFIIVYFKDGSTQLFFCGMYQPELMEKDRDRKNRIDSYYRHFLINSDEDNNIKDDIEEIKKDDMSYHDEEDPEKSIVKRAGRRK